MSDIRPAPSALEQAFYATGLTPTEILLIAAKLNLPGAWELLEKWAHAKNAR